MKNYGIQKSAVEPLTIEITPNKVFLSKNIELVTTVIDEKEIQEYQFEYIEYDKDEFILAIYEKNKDIERQTTDTQLALCDIYEMLN
jgi:hypothetical protein